MNLGITSRETTLQQLFAPGEELTMPPYQRSYSWTEKEAIDLLGDLRDSVRSNDPHFIGAIVIVQSDDEKHAEIVDGQQRLTTLTILLSVLRDLEEDKDRSDEIHSLIGDAGRPMLGEEAKWRLSLNHIDGPFFRETIQKPGATRAVLDEPGESDSQRRMTRTADAFAKELETLSVEERRALYKATITNCAIVRVKVADRDAGYRVFRVLNTRGKEPNAHDIIKTDLFERAGFSVSEANEHSRLWAEHEALLGGSAFDDLLHQIRFIYDKSNKGDLVSGFRKSNLGKISPRVFLTQILPEYVRAYREINLGDIQLGELSDKVNSYLNRLLYLDHHSWRAPALKFLVEKRSNPKLAVEFFSNLERLGYVIQLIIHNRDHRNKRYRRVIDTIDAAKLTSFFTRTGPFTITKEEARKVRERLNGRFAAFGQRRALALRLNAVLDQGITLAPKTDATVEHVLPRNPSSDSHWLKVWPNPQARRELCDTIGNFVLLPHAVNQKADRMSYQDKKKVYFNGSGGAQYALTRDLEHEALWTADTVRRRTDKLAELLCDDWKLNV
ncbi:MAG: DUF262 domain-containing HNH endonuclease family protein [Hyphomonadaceae bacterium]